MILRKSSGSCLGELLYLILWQAVWPQLCSENSAEQSQNLGFGLIDMSNLVRLRLFVEVKEIR